MVKKIRIYDIDGTIICSLHRYKTDKTGKRIDLAYWRKHDNEKYIFKDKLLPLAEQYKKDLKNPKIYVILATARACTAGDANYSYIEKYLGLPDKFIHRKGINDNRKGAQIKIQGIKPLLNLKQFKEASVEFFEDNLSYLFDVCKALNCKGFLIASNQGY